MPRPNAAEVVADEEDSLDEEDEEEGAMAISTNICLGFTIV